MSAEIIKQITHFDHVLQTQQTLMQALQQLADYYPGFIQAIESLAVISTNYGDPEKPVSKWQQELVAVIDKLRPLPTRRIFHELMVVEARLSTLPGSILSEGQETALRSSLRNFGDTLEKYLAHDNKRPLIVGLIMSAYQLNVVLAGTAQTLSSVKKALQDAHPAEEKSPEPDAFSGAREYHRATMPETPDQTDYEPFTKQEKREIEQSLIRFRRLLLDECRPTAEQLKQIDEKLDYLRKALDRLSRIDWRGVALSTAIGIATNLAVDTETGRKIIELFYQSFVQVLQLAARR